jgi:hypothetical protein
MRGLNVHAFSDFEESMAWLSPAQAEQTASIPLRNGEPAAKRIHVVQRNSERGAPAHHPYVSIHRRVAR